MVSFSRGGSAIAGDTPASTVEVVASLIFNKDLPQRYGKCEPFKIAVTGARYAKSGGYLRRSETAAAASCGCRAADHEIQTAEAFSPKSLRARLASPQTNCSIRIIFCHKLDNLFKISDCAVRDQDFEVHCGIMLFTSSIGRTRPASTSFRPRSRAASSSAASVSVLIANNSAARSALSRAFRFPIAVLIS